MKFAILGKMIFFVVIQFVNCVCHRSRFEYGGKNNVSLCQIMAQQNRTAPRQGCREKKKEIKDFTPRKITR